MHLFCGRMTLQQADVLEYYLLAVEGVQSVKVFDLTQDAIVVYAADQKTLIQALARFSFAKAEKVQPCDGAYLPRAELGI